ncbi:hypothetical protein QBC33DRAFT_519113 [Phialemonium atrogriseum]|uniref:Uncharacterized protein n=1 Tax=Phialemonium atrogriseum TaxID=1093897 RepID=A0AAJ0BRI1_9PEZI|nr:uncharacterized protein QBC33DRAFT_519113 [Phialemonium atrogriseum]KAK1762910.1 hypothetical protein QBC33DRAFT_519113 [Phialemonium atrogriseum]
MSLFATLAPVTGRVLEHKGMIRNDRYQGSHLLVNTRLFVWIRRHSLHPRKSEGTGQTLRAHGLLRHLTGDIQRGPETDSQKAQVVLLIERKPGSPRLAKSGLYGLIRRETLRSVLRKASRPMYEFSTLHRDDFKSMHKFQFWVQYLRRRHRQSGHILGDKVEIKSVLDALERYDLQTILIGNILDGSLTWDDVIKKLSAEVAMESRKAQDGLLQ